MKSIETREEFEQMLTLNKCLVFVAADWAQQSRIAEAKVRDWSRSSSTEVFRINIDNETLWKWMNDQARKLNDTFAFNGSGSLLFVKRGTVTNYVFPNDETLNELMQMTQRFFNNENYQNPAAG